MTIFTLLLIGLVFSASGQAMGQTKNVSQVSYSLGDLIVTATKTPHTTGDVPLDSFVITSEDIAHSGATNLMEVLDSVPGITTDVDDDIFGVYTWRATMQGLSFNDGYALVLVDGKRMIGSGQSGGMGEYGIGLNQIPLSMVERIEVVQGPSSVLYGSDAMTGVVNIITKPPTTKPQVNIGGSFKWYRVNGKKGAKKQVKDKWRNTEETHAHISGPLKSVASYALDYSYERAEDVAPTAIGSYRHTALGKVRFNPATPLDMELNTLLSHYEKAGYREEDSWRLDLDSSLAVGEDSRIGLKSYIYRWDFEHGFPGYAYGYKHGHQEHRQLEVQLNTSLFNGERLTLGGDYREQLLDYTIENKSNRIPVSKGIYTSSVFIQDEWTIQRHVVLVPGVRYEHHSVFGDELNPRLALKLSIGTNTLRMAVGRAFKSPTIRQLYYGAPYEHGSFYIASNPDLEPEVSWGYSVSLQRPIQGHGLLWMSFFRHDVRDLVARIDAGDEFLGKPLLTYENIKDARIQGLEFQFKKAFWGCLSLQLTYTYTDSEDLTSQKDLPYVPIHDLVSHITYWILPLDLEVSTKLHYVGRQFTNLSNTSTIKDHATIDLQVAKKFMGEKAHLRLIGQNIFGSRKGDLSHYREGRSLMVRLDIAI